MGNILRVDCLDVVVLSIWNWFGMILAWECLILGAWREERRRTRQVVRTFIYASKAR
jgi:hypothetical protein